MKRQELHLLNRIYIHPPDKKILPYFGDSEDVITPEKIVAILNKLQEIEYDKVNKNAILRLYLPKSYRYDINRHTIYVMTRNLDMFQTLKDLNYQDEDAILNWLKHYWETPFLMTFPIYFYKTLPCTFHLKNGIFTLASNNYHYLVERGLYTIGDGLTLLLSLNSIGWISNEITQRVFHRITDFNVYNIPDEWITYYYPHNLRIADYPFLYAFQFCHPYIYQYMYKNNHLNGNRVYYLTENNTNMYISNIFTVNLNPQNHHYKFLKQTKQSWFYIRNVHLNLHFNVHQKVLGILQSSSHVYEFLSNGLNRGFLIHCIYKNKRLGLLKFIQSISYLYYTSDYSKRYLKLIWRNVMKEFKSDFTQIMYIYLIEYFLLVSNAKGSVNLLCPPLKMLRDTMYLLKENFSLHKEIEIPMIIAKKYHSFLDNKLFHSPREIRASHDKYLLTISFLKILKLIKRYDSSIEKYLERMNKKRITLLQCCHKKSYELYQIMQEYYRNQPDALWKV